MTTVACPNCGNTRAIRASDVKRVRQCRRCHLSQIGRKGYAATAEKYGEKFAVRFVRDYRLANPSCLERMVMAWLDSQGVAYEREYWLETGDGQVFLVDFMIGATAIEVNGAWAHSHHHERDRHKVDVLRQEDFHVLVLSEADVTSGAFADRLSTTLLTNPAIMERETRQ